MELPRCEFRRGTATSPYTPDSLTCGPTAMTRAIAPLGGEAYIDEMMGRLPCGSPLVRPSKER